MGQSAGLLDSGYLAKLGVKVIRRAAGIALLRQADHCRHSKRSGGNQPARQSTTFIQNQSSLLQSGAVHVEANDKVYTSDTDQLVNSDNSCSARVPSSELPNAFRARRPDRDRMSRNDRKNAASDATLAGEADRMRQSRLNHRIVPRDQHQGVDVLRA